MAVFKSFSGTITMISDFLGVTEGRSECYKLISVENEDDSIVNFVVSPGTYFVDHVTVELGDKVTGFYDANAPVPLIYPPQLRAIVIAKDTVLQNVKVSYFDSDLISSDGTLKLNISPYTKILLRNDQLFTANPANRNLIVVYGATTRSIPAQTTPYKIIIIC